MKVILLSLAVATTSECLAQDRTYRDSCQASEIARALCDQEARLTDALRRNDADLLAQIYADDFQLTNYRGTKVGRGRVIDAIRTGALRFDSLTSSELEMRIYERAAVVVGRQHQVVREPGGDEKAHPKDVRFTHLYVLSAGRWRLVSSQITPILSPGVRRDTGHRPHN
jgi:uncharacterized protein (TIGR02246 family)